LLNDPRTIGENQTLRTKNLVPYAKGILEKRKGSALSKEILAVYNSEYPPEQSDTYVKATSYFNPDAYGAFRATDPSNLLIGSGSHNSWASSGNAFGVNQRFHIDLGSTQTVKRIYYENFHHDGTQSGFGVQNFTFWGSNTAGDFADLTYANNGTWVQLTTSQSTFDRHAASDVADPKYITATNTTAYRYYGFKFADNYGDPERPEFMGIRRIELQVDANASNLIQRINELRVVKISSDKYVIAAANLSEEDTIYYSKNGADLIRMTGTTDLTAGLNYSITVDHQNYIYIANGSDTLQVSTDGETRADVSYDNQTRNGKYCLWWKDRLWLADADNNAIYFSENLEPTNFAEASVLYPGNKDPNNPITGICPLTMTTSTEGIINILLVFRKNSIWTIGFDTQPTYVDQLSGVIGCWDDKSICSTPFGVIFVGKDTVYQIGSTGEPQPIGNIIKPIWDGSHILRGRNTTYRRAASIYFNGFVHIAYPETEVYNNREYYLDLRDYSNIGWFGDHSGNNISCYAVDGNTLYAGSSTDGKVLLLEQASYQDSGVDIGAELQTRLCSVDGSTYTTKIFKRYGFNLLSEATTSFTVAYDIEEGKITNSTSYPLTIDAGVWDTATWDSAKWWGGSVFQIIRGFFRPMDRGHFIGYTISESSSSNIKIMSGLMSFLKTGRIL